MLERRLERIEATFRPARIWRCHTIMGHTDEELNAKEAELRASGAWLEGDNLIRVRFVEPCHGEERRTCGVQP
jgi:hypothetical protein